MGLNEVDNYFCKDTELQNYNKTGVKRIINPFIFQNNFQFLLVHFLYFFKKSPGPDGLNARVLKKCSNEISPILALIFNETLARGDVPDEWRQANVSPVFKKGENMMLLITDRCRSHASAAKP